MIFFLALSLGCISAILILIYGKISIINDNILDILKLLECSERRKNQLFDFLEEHSSFYRKREKGKK